MKPMSLNLSRMKKIGGDQHSTTFVHPDGHQIKIAHSGVNALQRRQLEKMPIQRFDQGGDAQLPPELSDLPQDTTPAADPSLAERAGSVLRNGVGDALGAVKTVASGIGNTVGPAVADFAKGLIKGDGSDADSASPDPTRDTASLPSSPMPDAPPQSVSNAILPPPSNDRITAAYNKGQQAISEQQKIDSAKAQADEDIIKNDMVQRQALNDDFKTAHQVFGEHQRQLMDDYMNNHVDPKHYQQSMGTGQKITTAIGLLLGGMSAGTLGGENPAAKFLHDQITRDIDAQKSRIDQQKTLLGANQELYHDDVTAMNQTRVNMNDIYNHQIQLAAAKLGTPQAKQIADASSAKYALENAQLLQQNAMRATVMKHLAEGGTGLNAIDLSNAGLIPQPEAVKEQASLDAQKTAITKTQALYSELNKEQTAGNLLNPQSSRRVAALNAELVNAVMNASASKRLTRESVEQEIAPLEIKTTDNEGTRGSKLQGVLNIIERHADPTPYMKHYSPGSLPHYNQAPSNPLEGKTASDAKGNRVIMKNGRWVPYGG